MRRPLLLLIAVPAVVVLVAATGVALDAHWYLTCKGAGGEPLIV